MNHLLRELAPVTDRGWELLEEEARRQLTAALAARKLVDFSGPHGYRHSATNLGRTDPVADPAVEGVELLRRQVLPLIERRVYFRISRAELAAADRGAEDPDLNALGEAARRIALAENRAVFDSIASASAHEPIGLSELRACPRHAAEAVDRLLGSGVGGPYGLALGPESYRGVIAEAEHGGVLLFDHLRHIVGGPLVWAPGVSGAVVVSLRGGDFLFDCGQDLALGYDGYDEHTVHLYLLESFSFRVATPEAGVALPGP